MPVIACQNCGQEFPVHPCHVKAGIRKFCSRHCRHSSQSGGREQIVALRKQGRKLKEIAEETGFSEGYVRTTMMLAGLTESQRHRRKRGQRSRRRVVELRQRGWKQQEIADQLRLTVGYVKRILSREGLTQPQQYRERGQASRLRVVELQNQGLSHCCSHLVTLPPV